MGSIIFMATGDPAVLVKCLKNGVTDTYKGAKHIYKGSMFKISYQMSAFKRWMLLNI